MYYVLTLVEIPARSLYFVLKLRVRAGDAYPETGRGGGRLPEHSNQAAPAPFPFRHENDTHVDVNRARTTIIMT